MPAKLLLLVFLLNCGAVALGQVSVGDAAPGEARDANASEFKARVEKLIRELGDEQFEVREAAAKGLASAGSRARPYLELATKSADPEVAGRAKAILDSLPKLSHTLVDALGQPIPLATVTVNVWTKEPGEGIASTATKPSQTLTVTSEEDGRVGIPPIDAGNVAYWAMVHHPDYGRAQTVVESAERNPMIQLPLVRRGTEAHRRAVSGQVVNPDGKPVAGAVIHCTDIRTPGMGLIEGKHPRGEALSDDDGRFTLYLPNENRRSERGVLVPANSRYLLRVTVPGDDAYFPVAGRYANVEPARIELPRVTRFHRFRFEAAGRRLGEWRRAAQQRPRAIRGATRRRADAHQPGARGGGWRPQAAHGEVRRGELCRRTASAIPAAHRNRPEPGRAVVRAAASRDLPRTRRSRRDR